MHDTIRLSATLRAQPATIWSFITADPGFAQWWGPGSTIEPELGGVVAIVYPNQIRAGGEVLTVEPERSLEFSFGYLDSTKPVHVGGSLVGIGLRPEPLGTRVDVRHDLSSAELVAMHLPGWRYQLSILARLVHAEQHREHEAMITAWFEAWNTSDAEIRTDALTIACTDDVEFADKYAWVQGRSDLIGHLSALAIHMPNVALLRVGAVRYAQGTALVDWEARRGDAVLMAGTNVFEFAADGRVARVVGIPSA